MRKFIAMLSILSLIALYGCTPDFSESSEADTQESTTETAPETSA